MKDRATTNEYQNIQSENLKRRGNKHKIVGNHPTKKKQQKQKQRKEQRRNIESPGEQDLKW